ncbi:uncharacterized protein N7511_007316 [Penicillium nucicola]|uniref:uncharacterized protein n=1 Tax=Penicillium nucicola TaxID=1850975 RepID=UPI0025454CE8|nr:uncharacterized protein N7511_007316 [Penicillium nucicola]KAJ5757134.1 hypothetical protein N7511_007316 [Penicillium nucicola]
MPRCSQLQVSLFFTGVPLLNHLIEPVDRLTDLAYLVSGLLGDFASLSGNGSTTPISTSSTGTATSSTGIATPSKGTVLATSTTTPIAVLGCSIFQSYMSLCSWTVSGSHSSIALDSSALASCACYSSTYYVPDALDSAALACARYTAGSTSTATNTNLAAATTASSFTGFCAGMSNVRDYPSAEFAKATEPPTSSPSVTAESESNDGRRLGVSEVPVLIVIATFITLLL